MIMLKSTNKRIVGNYTELLSLTNKELAGSKKSASLLELRNCELNTKLAAAKIKVDKLEDATHELHQNFDNANETIKELRKIIKVLEKDKLELDFCNEEAKKEIKKLNAKAQVNAIAKNQLRDLCVYKNNKGRTATIENDVIIHKKIDCKKVWDLTMLMV